MVAEDTVVVGMAAVTEVVITAEVIMEAATIMGADITTEAGIIMEVMDMEDMGMGLVMAGTAVMDTGRTITLSRSIRITIRLQSALSGLA
jgi:hypothetical protein